MQYVIIPTADLCEDMANVCAQSCCGSVRKSNDDSLVVLKYEGTKPACLVNYPNEGLAATLAITEGAAWNYTF